MLTPGSDLPGLSELQSARVRKAGKLKDSIQDYRVRTTPPYGAGFRDKEMIKLVPVTGSLFRSGGLGKPARSWTRDLEIITGISHWKEASLAGVTAPLNHTGGLIFLLLIYINYHLLLASTDLFTILKLF